MQGQQRLLLGPACLCLSLLLFLSYRGCCSPLLQDLVQHWCYGKVCLPPCSAAPLGAVTLLWMLPLSLSAGWCGVVFVVLVIMLTSSIVAIAYLCVLPLILQTYSVPQHFSAGFSSIVTGI